MLNLWWDNAQLIRRLMKLRQKPGLPYLPNLGLLSTEIKYFCLKLQKENQSQQQPFKERSLLFQSTEKPQRSKISIKSCWKPKYSDQLYLLIKFSPITNQNPSLFEENTEVSPILLMHRQKNPKQTKPITREIFKCYFTQSRPIKFSFTAGTYHCKDYASHLF